MVNFVKLYVVDDMLYELCFHYLHKNSVIIDKCLQMKYENPNESEYIENT